MKRALAALALVGAGCGQLGGTVCSLNTQATYRIDFDPAFTAPGKYQIDLTLDGEAAVCDVDLPGLVALSPCPPQTPQVVQSNGKLTNITFFGAPRQVDVKVTFGGTQVAAATFTPSWSKPNDCGQVSAPAGALQH